MTRLSVPHYTRAIRQSAHTHLPPLLLADWQLHAVAVESQVQDGDGDVLRRVADAHGSVVTVSEQRPGSLSDGGPGPGVPVHQGLD